MRRPKVALVAPFPPAIGGQAELAGEIARGLEEDGFEVMRVRLASGRKSLLTLPILYAKECVAAVTCDVVHTVSASGTSLVLKDLPALLLARLFGRKAILHFVGGAAFEKAGRWGFLSRMPFRVATTVVVPTEAFASLIQGTGLSDRVQVIPNAVVVEPFLELRSSAVRPVLLAAKALAPYAGFDLLVQVLEEVQREVPSAELWIAGDGPTRGSLEEMVRLRRVQGVRFLGAVPHSHMSAFFGEARVFVHGTRYESFGIVLVEAMAAALPVVAFGVGGIPEVVKDGETGFLLPYGEMNAFASKVSTLLTNEELRLRIGGAGRAWASRFGWDRVRTSWEDLYVRGASPCGHRRHLV